MTSKYDTEIGAKIGETMKLLRQADGRLPSISKCPYHSTSFKYVHQTLSLTFWHHSPKPWHLRNHSDFDLPPPTYLESMRLAPELHLERLKKLIRFWAWGRWRSIMVSKKVKISAKVLKHAILALDPWLFGRSPSPYISPKQPLNNKNETPRDS